MAIELQSLLLVFTVCLVLVITTAGNFRVSAATQQYEAQILESGCPNTQDHFKRVRNELLQDIELKIELISNTVSQSLTTAAEDTQSTELQATGQTTKQELQTTGQTIKQELPTTGQTTELTTELPTTGQTIEQTTELPTTGQNNIQTNELPTTGQTTKQSTDSELPTTGSTAEHNIIMSTTTEPLSTTCNGTPGWRQAVFINMTDTSYECPSGLSLTSYSKRTCGQAQSYGPGMNCSSTIFSVGGTEYSRVCGRIRGYQVGPTLAFYGYLQNSHSFEEQYLDGVSLTHGPIGGRNHIWTFASGINDLSNPESGADNIGQCPCTASNSGIRAPPFVGNDFFCESGSHIVWTGSWRFRFFPDDPLWDGQGCSSTSTCCQLNNPPWFTKNLPNPTTDDIELRLCLHHGYRNTNIAIELIELYIQ